MHATGKIFDEICLKAIRNTFLQYVVWDLRREEGTNLYHCIIPSLNCRSSGPLYNSLGHSTCPSAQEVWTGSLPVSMWQLSLLSHFWYSLMHVARWQRNFLNSCCILFHLPLTLIWQICWILNYQKRLSFYIATYIGYQSSYINYLQVWFY